MRGRERLLGAAAFLAVLGLVLPGAHAALITVANGSFESHALGSDTSDAINGGTSNNGVVPDWYVSCATFGYAGERDPGDSLYTGAAYPNNIPGGYAQGKQSGYLHWGAGTFAGSQSYLQTVNAVTTIKTGWDYTLTVAFGTPKIVGDNSTNTKVSSAQLIILANNVAVATTTITPPAKDSWSEASVTLTKETIAASGLNGQEMKLKLWAMYTGSGGKRAIDFDNLRLDGVPEPAAMGFLVIGAVGLLLRKRRR